MGDHEESCSIAFGYNWCTCIYYAEQQALRGFALHLSLSGQVACPGGHEDWWIGTRRCPWCKAVV